MNDNFMYLCIHYIHCEITLAFCEFLLRYNFLLINIMYPIYIYHEKITIKINEPFQIELE